MKELSILYWGDISFSHEELLQLGCNKDEAKITLIERAYYMYGDKIAYHIDGSYGISIVDHRKSCCILIRDRLGIEQVFYCVKQGEVLAAKSISTLLLLYHGKVSINEAALYDYLTYLAVPKSMTLYFEINKVEPGHYVVVSKGEIVSKCYWNVADYLNSPRYDDERDAAEHIEQYLQLAINRETGSNNAIALSEGVDSNLLVSLMDDLSGLVSYTLVSCENETSSTIDERGMRRNIIPANYNYFDCFFFDIKNLIRRRKYPCSLPDEVALSSLLLEIKKDRRDVCIFGEGADEISSYPDYMAMSRINSANKRGKRIGKNEYYEGEYIPGRYIEAFTESEKRTFWKGRYVNSSYQLIKELFNEIRCDVPDAYYRKLKNVGLKFKLPELLLMRTTQACYFNNVKAKFPFLDRELVEYCLSLNNDYFVKGEPKSIFRKIIKSHNLIIELEQRKTGLGNETIPWLVAHQSDMRQKISGLPVQRAEKYIDINLALASADSNLKLWALYTTICWLNSVDL